MGRFMYIHFDDEVPDYIEKEYNKMLRKEKYLDEKEVENGRIYPDFDDVLLMQPDPDSLPMNEIEEENQKRYRKRLEILPFALEMLKKNYYKGYVLIYDYYLSGDNVTLTYLVNRYDLSFDTVRYRLRAAREKLKKYIILYENIC